MLQSIYGGVCVRVCVCVYVWTLVIYLCHKATLFCYLNLLEYRDAFALFDKRGDGKIDSDQIGDVMRALGLNPTEAEVKKIVQEIDPKGKNEVELF